MILIIDNYDSFVYNIARYVKLAGMEPHVVRNDQISAQECIAVGPTGVILSPGPKAPKDAGICMDLLGILPRDIPMLGVCLGHQCLGEVFGGRTVKASHPLHGEATHIEHDGNGIFLDLPSPIRVGRYHSLITQLSLDATPLKVTARSAENEIMAIQHQTAPWFGVQFHPESVLTEYGNEMINNFVTICKQKKMR